MFCSVDQSNVFYSDINSLKKSLLILKEQQIFLKNIVLTGGEPLLHPNFLNICFLIREIFPDLQISIFTNGLLIKQLNKEELNFLKKINIEFSISLYPDLKIYQQVTEVINFLKKNNFVINELEKSRPIFSKTVCKLNNKNKNNYLIQEEKFKECGGADDINHNNNIFLYDNKILNCSTIIGFLNCGITEIPQHDYVLVNKKITNESIWLLKKQPNFLCSYCEGGDKILWHKQFDLKINNNLDVKNIFLFYYDIYKILQDDSNVYKILTNTQFNFGRKTINDINQWDVLNTRLIGQKDIGFIFQNKDNITIERIQKFKIKLLNKKNINNYNIYIICINLSIEQETILYDNLKNMYLDTNNLNTYFIKENNLNKGILYFLQNSYCKITIFKKYKDFII